MTNAEKFLKDGECRQFLTVFSRWYYSIIREIKNVDTVLAEFLAEKVQPILTEDERAILRNVELNRYNKIGRKLEGALYLKETTSVMLNSTFDDFFNSSLFQFIKERRRIFY